jgi:hypothetical protein
MVGDMCDNYDKGRLDRYNEFLKVSGDCPDPDCIQYIKGAASRMSVPMMIPVVAVGLLIFVNFY